MMHPDEPVVRCTDLCLNLDGISVLAGINFAMGAGEFVALLGDNGAGKSSLVRAILGLVRLSSGKVSLFGTDLRRFRAWERIGYVPQRGGAASALPATVSEVVLSGRASFSPFFPAYTTRDRELANSALEEVNLAGNAARPVASLSGGQQQRVLIARALVREPAVLILDEPAAGIDAESQEALSLTLGTQTRLGRTVLLVAHGLGPMASFVSRTVVLESGRVVYDGPPLEEAAGAGHLHVHHHRDDAYRAAPVLHEGVHPPR